MDIVPTGGSGRTMFDYTADGTAMGVAVKVGTGRSVTLVNRGTGAVDVIVVVEGYFSATAADGAGLQTSAARLLDTRSTVALVSRVTDSPHIHRR